MKSNEQFLNSQNSPSRGNQSRSSSSISRVDLKSSGALDSKKLLASQLGQPFLDTISSNESRYGNSPNFLIKQNNIRARQDGMIQVPQMLNLNQIHQLETLSYSASTEFGQHSLRSSVENQQQTVRGFNVDQIKAEQNLLMEKNQAILEESKEEDMSFNKTLSGQSPIPGKHFGNHHRSSIDDGTQSFVCQTGGNSRENTGIIPFKSTTIGGLAGNARPSLSIHSVTNTSPFKNRTGNIPKGRNQTAHLKTFNQRFTDNMLQDKELLEELSKVNRGRGNNFEETKNGTLRQDLISSLQLSEDALSQEQVAQNQIQSTFKEDPVKKDFIHIDDNQFVTLSQVQEEYLGGKHKYGHQINTGGRPSNVSNFGGAAQGYSDSSSSNPTTLMNTPNQNIYKSRVSPYTKPEPYSDQTVQSSQRCECCKGRLSSHNSRPVSGLSVIETKNLNFIESNELEQNTPHLPSENDQSTKIISSNNMRSENTANKNVLCSDCQSRQFRQDIVTPNPLQSDLRVSQLSTTFQPTSLKYKSQHYQNNHPNDENTNITSNFGQSTQNQYKNQPISVLQATSSMMGQSELQHSSLTGSYQPFQYLQNNSQVSNPSVAQGSSLQYLSQLSQNIGSQVRHQSDDINNKYGLNSADNYKVTLKSFMQRQFERSAKCDPLPYSRIFRDRQSRRHFDQLQSIKASYATTYEELETMHANLLTGKRA